MKIRASLLIVCLLTIATASEACERCWGGRRYYGGGPGYSAPAGFYPVPGVIYQYPQPVVVYPTGMPSVNVLFDNYVHPQLGAVVVQKGCVEVPHVVQAPPQPVLLSPPRITIVIEIGE